MSANSNDADRKARIAASYAAAVTGEYVIVKSDRRGPALVEETYTENGKPYAVIYFKDGKRETFLNDGTELEKTGKVLGQQFTAAGRRKSRRRRTRRSRRRTAK
jgi:hypothetical protein